MNVPARKTKWPSNELGALMRQWRDLRGKSQLGLSIESGISQRHISFVESGRSVPSRETLIALAETLDIPLRERNALFLAAGYAPIYSDSAWDAAEMQSVTGVLKRMLRQHEPFPAVVMDRYWNVLIPNASAPKFFNSFIDLESHPRPRNILRLMFDPKGMRPFIANWEETAKSLMQRVYRESVGRVVDDKTRDLIAALLAYPDVQTGWKTSAASNPMPVVPIGFLLDGKVLNYFSLVTTVGTPLSVAAQELRIECMYPADHATEMQHLKVIGADPKP